MKYLCGSSGSWIYRLENGLNIYATYFFLVFSCEDTTSQLDYISTK